MLVSNRIVMATAIGGVLFLSACATTQLKEQWRDPDYQSAAASRVLVIAMLGNAERRRTFEETLVARLRQEGVDAVASYPSLSVDGTANVEAARRSVSQTGTNVVLAVRLLRVMNYVRVAPYYAPGSYGPAGFYGFYNTYPQVPAYTNAPAYVYESSVETTTFRDFITEARVFDMKSDKMVWAATLETAEPNSFEELAERYANVVVKQMRDNRIITGEKK